jgi:hypothetical protein
MVYYNKMNYHYFMRLFLYLLEGTGKSFLYSKSNIIDNIRLLKKAYPYNVYIIDCCEYYNDETVVSVSNSIIQKKKTIMNDYMNMNTNTTYTPIDRQIKNMNIIFILNIHTFNDSNKNLLQFINSLDVGKETSVVFVSEESVFYNLQNNYDNEFNINDFEKIHKTKNDISNPFNLDAYVFKNYKNLTKYKKDIFPFDKIKVTKKRTEKYISNIVFIEDNKDTDKQKTQVTLTMYNDMDYMDYKKILIHYLLCDDFNYSVLFNVSHYENIPLILYENIEYIIGKTNIDIQEFVGKTREMCLKYYSYDNDPDMYLFRKSNLYYFMYNFKRMLNIFNINLKISNLRKIKFTKYYSNRASEIQSQNAIQTYSFL